MNKKIKTIYLILGIPLLLLIIIVLLLIIIVSIILIYKQINWDFFSFNQKECLAEYLFNESRKYNEVERMTYEDIEMVSEIWGLDKTKLHSIAEKFSEDWEIYNSGTDNCWDKFGDRSICLGKRFCIKPTQKQLNAFLQQPEAYQECMSNFREPTSYTPFKDFIKGKTPILTKPIIEKLISQGICLRPPFLK